MRETISVVERTADDRQDARATESPLGAGAVETGAQPRSEHGDEGAARSVGGGAAAAGQAPAPGLVIYAKTGRSTSGLSAMDVPDTPEMASVLGFRFPSAAEIADAGVAAEWILRGDVAPGDRMARVGSGEIGYDRHSGVRAMFPKPRSSWTVHDAGSREGLTFSLRIASGAVSLSATNPDRDARRVERGATRSAAVSPRLAEWVAGQCPDGVDTALWWGGMDEEEQRECLRRAVSTTGAVDLADRPEPTREVTEWSRKSRASMVKALAELDYSPMEGELPVMVTLTYPRCWLRVAPTGKAIKLHLKAFRKRFERRYGDLAALWKLEFQGRKRESRCGCEVCSGRDDGRAPHIHLWLARPTSRIVRRRGADPVRVTESHSGFVAWLSSAWAEIVGHPDVEQRALHERAGTAVDLVQGLRGSDPKRLAIYFSKHGAAQGDSSGKEYQHLVPEAWRGPGDGPGRFWGYWRFERIAASVTLSPEDFVMAKRLLRRWSRSRASYPPGHRFPTEVFPATARRRVRRGDGFRWSTSRRQLFTHSGMSGGFACTNDGVALAISLVRSLRPERDAPPPYWVRSDFARAW